jgi:catechol 2,3-dioxygenase-like lactoylglutathione lyase family enzyme
MLRVGSIVLRVDDLRRQTEFWTAALDYVPRNIALGATEVHWDKRPPDADYVILADPEGNRFCVIDAG